MRLGLPLVRVLTFNEFFVGVATGQRKTNQTNKLNIYIYILHKSTHGCTYEYVHARHPLTTHWHKQTQTNMHRHTQNIYIYIYIYICSHASAFVNYTAMAFIRNATMSLMCKRKEIFEAKCQPCCRSTISLPFGWRNLQPPLCQHPLDDLLLKEELSHENLLLRH